MTINEAYERFTIKLSRNAGSDNITADKPRFVLSFNEQAIRLLEHYINNKNDDEVRYAQVFLVSGKELERSGTFLDRIAFKLPEDYLDISSAYAFASKGDCKSKKISLWQFKDDNYSEIVFNTNDKPSFEFEESPYILSSGKIEVFKDDFDIEKVILSYYQYPKKVDIEGYIHGDGTASTNIDPNFDDKIVNKIISMTVEDFQRNYQDQLGFQMGKDRILTNT